MNRLTILASTAIIALPAVAQSVDPQPKPVEELSPRSKIFRQSVAEVLATDPEGAELGRGLGVFIDSATVAVPWDTFEEAFDIEVTPICCDPSRVVGVVGSDAEAGILLIEIDPASLPSEHPIGPPAHADAKQIGAGEEVWVGSIPIRFGENGSKTFGIAVNGPRPIASVREWPGLGRQLLVEADTELFFVGTPVFNSEDELVAVTTRWGGHDKQLAAPIDKVTGIRRHEPIAPEAFASRDLSDPERAHRLTAMGQRKRTSGDFAEAVPLLEQAIATTDDNWRALYSLGVCFDLLGESTSALQAMHDSVSIEPGFCESLYSLGIILQKGGEFDAARQYYEQGRRLAPTYASLLGNLAALENEQGRLVLALDYAEQAAAIDEERFESTVQYIRQRLESNQGQTARLEREAENLNSSEAWYRYARNLWTVGNETMAIETMDRAADLAEPGDQRVLALSASMFWRITLDRYDEALRIAEEYADSGQKLADELLPFVRERIALSKGDLSSLLRDTP